MSAPKLKLTYFDIEAAGEPVRLALVLSGTPFEDNRISFADWAELKPKTPGGQLPVLEVDGGPMKTQSKAMIRWIGSAYSKTLYPTDKIFEVEEPLGIVEDLQRAWGTPLGMGMRPSSFGYPKDYAKTDEGKEKVKTMREAFVKNELPGYLDRLSVFLESTAFLAGDEPTIADCVAIPVLRMFTRGIADHVDPGCLNTHPKIVEYIKKFCSLEAIQGRYKDGIH